MPVVNQKAGQYIYHFFNFCSERICFRQEQEEHPYISAGWSSQVAREAHNLEVAGSNPVPATCFLVTNETA